MHETLRVFTKKLHARFEALIAQEPVTNVVLRPDFKGSGIYMFLEAGKSLYVGRTRDVRKRHDQHTRRSRGHNGAPFAFKLAREATGFLRTGTDRAKHLTLASCRIPHLEMRSKKDVCHSKGRCTIEGSSLLKASLRSEPQS